MEEMETNENNGTVNISWRLGFANYNNALQFDIPNYPGNPVIVDSGIVATEGVHWTLTDEGHQLVCVNVTWQNNPCGNIAMQWKHFFENQWRFSGEIVGNQSSSTTGEGLSPNVLVSFALDADGALIIGEIDTVFDFSAT